MQPPPGIGATVTADFLFFHARYVRAERAQLLFKVFIAAVDVFYVVYLASALRRKRSHYQRRARANQMKLVAPSDYTGYQLAFKLLCQASGVRSIGKLL